MSTAPDDTTPTAKQRRKPSQVIHASKADDAAGSNVRELRPTGPTEWTDSAVAEAFARHIADRYLYVPEWKQWLRWDGRRWERDVGLAVYEEARAWIAEQRKALIDRRVAESTERLARQFQSKPRIDAVVGLAQRMHGIVALASTFDNDRHLLTCRNGTIDLRTATLLPHNPAHRITKTTGVDYVPSAAHPDIDAALGAVDDEARPWVIRYLGYCATGEVTEDVLVVWEGGGANGKDTVLSAMDGALGEYASPVDSSVVIKRKHDEHLCMIAALQGKRFCYVNETPQGGALNVEKVKALTGGGRLQARWIAGNPTDFEQTEKLLIVTNHLPFLGENDHAIGRRLRLVPFPYRYADPHDMRPGDRPIDRGLRERLRHGEPQRQAMLAKLVQGAADYYRDGLGTSTTITAAAKAWRLSTDKLTRFIDECLDFQPTLSLTGGELYAEYSRWCESEGHKAVNGTTFAADFMSHENVIDAGVTKRKSGTIRYSGVGFKPRHTRGHDPIGPPPREGQGGFSIDSPNPSHERTTGQPSLTLPADTPLDF